MFTIISILVVLGLLSYIGLMTLGGIPRRGVNLMEKDVVSYTNNLQKLKDSIKNKEKTTKIYKDFNELNSQILYLNCTYDKDIQFIKPIMKDGIVSSWDRTSDKEIFK